MKTQKLSITNILFIGSMLFGLFFGAGNLIFPVFLGQEAGSNVLPAAIGFIITAAGLPFLGVVAFGTSQTDDTFELASLVNTKYALLFTVLLHLTIGPLFALPRTGTVAFEVSFASYLSPTMKPWALLIFSIIFFGLTLFFALRSSKILVWVGKILNPLFLIFLFLLIGLAIFQPMGAIPTQEVSQSYASIPLATGFTDGYQTMDALAALAFGSIVIQTIQKFGVKDTKTIATTTLKAGVISTVGMIIIYGSLAWLGATSLNVLPHSSNGGILLSRIAHHYFGSFGTVLLALIVTIACLKTAIGVATACADTFARVLPFKVTYNQYVIVFIVFTAIIANIGLEQIITLAIPVLMFLYPLCITLILLGLITPFIAGKKNAYLFATIGAGIIGIADFLKNLPPFLSETPLITGIVQIYEQYVPLYSMGLGWIIPMLLGFILGLCIDSFNKK